MDLSIKQHKEFMKYFDTDQFAENLKVAEAEHLFLNSLMSASDITVELISQLIINYGDESDVVVMSKEDFNLLMSGDEKTIKKLEHLK